MSPWVALFVVLWVAQLALIGHDLTRGSGWGQFQRYWGWRRLYRPAIALVEGTSRLTADHVGGERVRFSPLNAASALTAFVVCTGLYALAGTALAAGARRGAAAASPA